jgi:hypothetical protein
VRSRRELQAADSMAIVSTRTGSRGASWVAARDLRGRSLLQFHSEGRLWALPTLGLPRRATAQGRTATFDDKTTRVQARRSLTGHKATLDPHATAVI